MTPRQYNVMEQGRKCVFVEVSVDSSLNIVTFLYLHMHIQLMSDELLLVGT